MSADEALRLTGWTEAQLGWLAAHPMYEACGTPRSNVRFHDCGTLYADGSFEAMVQMKPVRLETGCRLVGVPHDLYLTGAPNE